MSRQKMEDRLNQTMRGGRREKEGPMIKRFQETKGLE